MDRLLQILDSINWKSELHHINSFFYLVLKTYVGKKGRETGDWTDDGHF